MTTEDLDVTGYILCSTCWDPYQTAPGPGFPTPQRCSCRRRGANDPRWDGYDFNEHLDLCRCCRMQVLHSGSRWSVWFCEECKARIRSLNARAGRAIVPIGRHSLMARVGVRGTDVTSATDREVDRIVERFAARLGDWLGGFDPLDAFTASRSEGLRALLGFTAGEDVELATWLERLRAAVGRDPAAFGADASFGKLLAALAPR